MNRFGRLFGWVLAAALCCVLVAMPVQATETEKGEASKDSKKTTRESDLVKASREIQAKKTGSATTYSNEDLEAKKPAAKVYTNEDLTQKYGSSEESGTATSQPEDRPASGSQQDLPDPLALMEQEKQSQANRADEIAKAESALAAAQAKLANLEKQLLATSNPFSARPELSAEEQEARATSGESAAERRARTQKMVDEARQEVADAEANLSQARSQ